MKSDSYSEVPLCVNLCVFMWNRKKKNGLRLSITSFLVSASFAKTARRFYRRSSVCCCSCPLRCRSSPHRQSFSLLKPFSLKIALLLQSLNVSRRRLFFCEAISGRSRRLFSGGDVMTQAVRLGKCEANGRQSSAREIDAVGPDGRVRGKCVR